MDRLDCIEGRIEEVLKLVGKKNPDESIIKAGASHTISSASSPLSCTKEVRWNVGFRIYSLNVIQTTENGKINVGVV